MGLLKKIGKAVSKGLKSATAFFSKQRLIIATIEELRLFRLKFKH